MACCLLPRTPPKQKPSKRQRIALGSGVQRQVGLAHCSDQTSPSISFINFQSLPPNAKFISNNLNRRKGLSFNLLHVIWVASHAGTSFTNPFVHSGGLRRRQRQKTSLWYGRLQMAPRYLTLCPEDVSAQVKPLGSVAGILCCPGEEPANHEMKK